MEKVAVPEGFDFTDPSLIEQRIPAPEFAALRRAGGLRWNPQPRGVSGFDDDGCWVVTRHADVMEASRDHAVYSTHADTALIRYNEQIGHAEIDMLKSTLLINLDPPEHSRLRTIVSRGFTPRVIERLRDALRDRAERIVARAVREGTGDFVTDVAVELPLQAIAELLGVPQEDRGKLFTWSNQMLGYDDPELNADMTGAAAGILEYSMGLAEARRAEPADDIVTRLVQAGDSGGLTDDEFGFFFIVLAVAGNETTRNAITHGMMAFLDHPEQWAHYRAERPATAADEIVRWATPVIAFQRTALSDTVLGGTEVKAGQRLALYYSSANYDETVFTDPFRFDITRSPNPHLGFGGTGPHYCIGANLARLEIDIMFQAIAEAMPGIRRTGTPRRLRSSWIHGIKELPVSYA
ncbi:cholest-4-en-3-one 26-monooxygenase [Actinocorallia herbida]|uniref:Cholest-4-en-3-one 26-monooxygenase n=1 Tax=Actinocorallia herbida TaxID=58109 RepID=A0A3N1D630_9ACTN|nr:cytochrome P450 [Actinocorallia herbida]ROO88995.1 cholest-4-en-3-one 26-monooxygenase [Actinocorallia herbida]